MNIRIGKGELRHLDGQPVQMHMDSALTSSDGQFIYPVVDGILILLPSLAIGRTEYTHATICQRSAPETDSAMRFYDEIGWRSGEDHNFRDAERFEDLRPVSREYIHLCHLRINKHISPRGEYLLDVASGPVQYREYLTYSEGYDRRICADISITALKAAKEKLGDRGIYIQCDITQLPLKDASVDGFVSLHTIYHVPAEKQIAAFRQLERVLMNDRTGVVVYTWGPHCLTMELLTAKFPLAYALQRFLRSALPAFLVGWLKRASGAHTPAGTAGHPSVDSTTNGPRLYFHPHDYAWFQRNIASRADWDILVWRSVSVPFLKRYVHAGRLGGPLLSALFRIENAFPGCFGRFGQYPLMVHSSSSEQYHSTPGGTSHDCSTTHPRTRPRRGRRGARRWC